MFPVELILIAALQAIVLFTATGLLIHGTINNGRDVHAVRVSVQDERY